MGQQYDKLMQRKAFMDTYKKESMFEDNLDEFDDSREAVHMLVEEYEEAEKPNYLDWNGDRMNEEYEWHYRDDDDLML